MHPPQFATLNERGNQTGARSAAVGIAEGGGGCILSRLRRYMKERKKEKKVQREEGIAERQ